MNIDIRIQCALAIGVSEKELPKLSSEMGFVKKSEVVKFLESQKCACKTNDIQYENCKRLLSEERNKTLDEVLKTCDIECGLYRGNVKNLTRHVLMRMLDELRE